MAGAKMRSVRQMRELEDFNSAGNSVSGGRAELIDRLEKLPGAERTRALFELVRAELLAVLRRIRPDQAAPATVERPFRELGLDSIGLIELHARLQAATGLGLPVTVAFEYPTATSLA